MAPNPSVSFPDWLFDEMEASRRTGEDQNDKKRATWLQEAAFVRLVMERNGTWEDPVLDPVKLGLPPEANEAVTDGGEDE